VEAAHEDRAAHASRALAAEAQMILHSSALSTPIGCLTLVSRDEVLIAVAFEGEEEAMRRWLARRLGRIQLENRADLPGAASILREYFEGDLAALDRVKVDTGGTPFQQEVWSELRRIRVGTTISYASLAARVGRPAAIRAVGAANGSNPIPVIIPCHRVIAADGTLCGYGGGLDRKRWLLTHEGALPTAERKIPAPSRQIPLW
jgi:methylated-DNA-[protein]-cysteine S-methyltransferase